MRIQHKLRVTAATAAMGMAIAMLPLMTAVPASAATQLVTITASGYVPGNFTIQVGDTVTYTNADTLVHQVEFKPSTGMTCTATPFVIQPTSQQSCTFTAAGSYTVTDPNVKGKTYRGTITVAAPTAGLDSVTLTSSKDRVIYGSSVTLSGNVNITKPGIQVDILAKVYPSTTFAKVGSVTTSGGGMFTFETRPEIRTEYQALAVDGTRKAYSTALTVQVRPKVTLALRYVRTNGVAGFRTTATSTKSYAGASVLVQRRNSAGGWTTMKTVKLGQFSALSFRVRVPQTTTRWRVVLPASQVGAGYASGISPVRVVTP